MDEETEEQVTYVEEETDAPPQASPSVQVVGVPSASASKGTSTGLLVAGAAVAAGLVWWLWPKKAEAAPAGPPAPGPSAPPAPSVDEPPVDNPPPPPPPPPPSDPIFGEVDFPPPSSGPKFDLLDRLASRAESTTGITGLRDYFVAVASGESAFNPSAMNVTTDGPGAFRLLCNKNNFGGRYRDNPWRPTVCAKSDPLAPRWSYSGGWFQMMPATALSTGDKVGYNMDPASVFVPARAVALATDLVVDFVKHWGAEKFADARAGWALPKWANADNTSEGKAKRVAKFKERLRKVSDKGVDVNLWNKRIEIGSYPGFHALLLDLLTVV